MSLTQFVPIPEFEDDKESFKDQCKMNRGKDDVILTEAHTRDGRIQSGVENHRSVGQMFRTIGADPKNEIMIFTGSGDEFMMDSEPDGFKHEDDNPAHWSYEHAWRDGRISSHSPDFDLDGGFGMQMTAHMQRGASVHGRSFIADTFEHVRQGRKNNFDE